AVACGAADKPAAGPENGLIATASTDGIHLIDARGSLDRLVPRTEGDWEVAWSPDGRQLAFSRYHGKNPNADVYTIRPDGSGRRLVLRNAMSPSWSPDAKRLVVSRSTCDEHPTDCAQDRAPRDLYTVNLDGGDVRRLTSDPDEKYGPEWSPDGKWIAFV